MDGRIYKGERGKMIEVKSSKGITDLKVSGGVSTIAADLMMIVGTVCKAITKEHPEEEPYLKVFINSYVNSGKVFKIGGDEER